MVWVKVCRLGSLSDMRMHVELEWEIGLEIVVGDGDEYWAVQSVYYVKK